MNKLKLMLILFAVGLLILAGVYIINNLYRPARYLKFVEWIRHPEEHPDWAISAGEHCGEAPFAMPSSGLVGFIWGDHFRIGHTHAGIDIFGGTESGLTPIYAAYDGYLTRMEDWKSSIIIRIPEDPLEPGRQIWTYYTHMADEDGNSYIVDAFPTGTHEVFVKEGTLLGFQGNYSGTSGNPTGIHLHFSVVKDDGSGNFLNELEIKNTLDPSPYLGLPLNSETNTDTIPVCSPTSTP